MADRIKEYLGLIQAEKKLVVKEFVWIDQLSSVLEEAKKRFLAVQSRKELEAAQKSLRRQCQKKVRRASRIERQLNRVSAKIISQGRNLLAYLPSSFRGELSKNYQQLEIFNAFILTYVSRSGGLLFKEIELFNLDQLEYKVKELLSGGINPWLAAVDNSIKYLVANKAKIEAEISKTENFTLDVKDVLRVVGQSQPIFLLDTSFIKKLAEEKQKKGRLGYNLDDLKKLGSRFILCRKVWEEATHRPLWIKQPLVPSQLLTYLRNYLKVEIVEVNPLLSEQGEVVEYWRATNKGRLTTSEEEKRFRKSGDMDIIVYSWRNWNSSLVILSNDTDIIRIALMLKRSYGLRLKVMSLKEDKIYLAAA